MSKRWIRIFIKLAVLGFLVWYAIHFVGFHGSHENLELVENWNITLNDTEYEDVDLEHFTFPVTGEGDVIVMRKTLEGYGLQDPMLQFHVYHAVIQVSLDGQEIFTYGEKYREQNIMVGNGYYWINLPDDLEGRELVITLKVSENNAFSSLDPVYLENAENIMLNFLRDNVLEIIIAGFLIVTGVFCLLFILFAWHRSKEYIMLIFLAAAALCCALWIASSFGILQMISLNYHMNSVIEFSSLYLASLFTLLFICELIEEGKYQKIIRGITTVNFLFTIVAIGCNALRILHLQAFLQFFHILAMISFCSIIVCLFLQLREKHSVAKRIFLVGVFITVVLIIGDIVRFNLEKYLSPNRATIVSVVPIAALCIVLTMATSYVVRMIQSYHANIEKDVLMKMAYTDALTAIPNRARCMEILQEMDAVIPTEDVSIVYMDLNFFKEINDTYGHGAGDAALIDFAYILQETFGQNGFVGRMAGDEFIAVFRGKEAVKEQTEAAIDRMIQAIAHFNEKKHRVYQLHTAYGCAYGGRRQDVTGWGLCEEADAQMYAYKKQMKQMGNRHD